MTYGVEMQGLDKWINRLEKAGDLSALRGTMQTATEILRDEVSVYPPPSEANTPGQRRWYERGYGPKWTLRDGRVNGRRTSQTLGRRWTTKVSDNGRRGEVGNNATYAPYVQSKAKQRRYHKARGWVTDEDAIKTAKPSIIDLFKAAIEKALG